MLGNKAEMDITQYIEQNTTLMRVGLFFEFNDARSRVANHLQKNIDRSKIFSYFFPDWIIFVQLALVLISRLIESLSSITEHVIPFSSHAGRSPMFGFINLNPYSSAIIQLTQNLLVSFVH